MKVILKCHLQQNKSCVDALPFVLGLRAGLKEDMDCSSAELLYDLTTCTCTRAKTNFWQHKSQKKSHVKSIMKEGLKEIAPSFVLLSASTIKKPPVSFFHVGYFKPKKSSATNSSPRKADDKLTHPLPFPPKLLPKGYKKLRSILPPKPYLTAFVQNDDSFFLRWNMPRRTRLLNYRKIKYFEIFNYVSSNEPISSLEWEMLRKEDAKELPMACALRDFDEGCKYFFAIRAIDVHDRSGNFSNPISIEYEVKHTNIEHTEFPKEAKQVSSKLPPPKS
ncbi:activating transcription factor 7-interacting protein 1 [Caerostris darwini]|uniref:Activating transcription factor 7-interacting protein 1 n=1 Tax=Caerostris darwini TaxID=1538125 RepID=A0AAV4REX6_9ARAC|nr:activating transcription factor 7-interacting protein 1 [Caerostris darwini]